MVERISDIIMTNNNKMYPIKTCFHRPKLECDTLNTDTAPQRSISQNNISTNNTSRAVIRLALIFVGPHGLQSSLKNNVKNKNAYVFLRTQLFLNTELS